MGDATGNDTKTALQEVVEKKSDVIVMNSRFDQAEQFFEVIRELGVSKQETVWIITETSSAQIRNYQTLPQGLLKIDLKRPEKHHDYNIYDNALYDAISLFQLSFEESIKEYCRYSDAETCLKEIPRKKIRRVSKRYLCVNL